MVGWTPQAALPSLELLNISGLDNVKKIWHNQLPQDSFTKLKDVKVASCGRLLNIFPSSMLKRLQSLQFLKAVDCSSLEEVFDMEGINVKEAVAVTQLSKLILQFLPKVKQIWNKEPHGILTFQNFKSVMIDQCQRLKNLFPASLVRDLVQLQELQVWSCGIEVIVAKDNGVKTAAKFVFPKVTSLRLSHLHQLRSFHPGAHTSQWPLLKELKVHECPEVDLFAFETPTFQQIHHMGNLDMLIHQPLFLVQQVRSQTFLDVIHLIKFHNCQVLFNCTLNFHVIVASTISLLSRSCIGLLPCHYFFSFVNPYICL